MQEKINPSNAVSDYRKNSLHSERGPKRIKSEATFVSICLVLYTRDEREF